VDIKAVSYFRNLKQQAIRKRYVEIYSHELAHKNAAGALAGPIVIEKDISGVPVGGHVSIQMPKVNPNNPEETIKKANIVKKAALAPSDPSSQDLKVASEADSVKSKAQKIQNRKKLDYYA